MRTIFLFLSISVFFTLVQYSDSAPRKIRLLKGGQLNMIAKRVVDKLKPFINDNDEIDEEMKKIVAVKLGEKSNYNSDETGEEKLSDKEIILSNFIDTDQKKISQSSAEK